MPAGAVTLEKGPGFDSKSSEGETCPRSLVFWPDRSTPLTSRSARRELKRACEIVGVPYFATHQLRRLRITQSLAAGADPNTVRASVGHRGILTTLGYLRDVPVKCELPALSEKECANPVANQYLGLVRRKNW